MADYYYRTRNGKRFRVRKGRNSLRVHRGKKISRVVARGAIPTSSGELYSKGALIVGDRDNSIKKDNGISIARSRGVVVIKGRAGKVKGGLAVGYKRGRRVDAIADYNSFIPTAKFETGYYTRTRRGKKERVRKKRSARPSYLARLLGKNRKMYTSPAYNKAIAEEMAKEMEKERREGSLTMREKLIGKRYYNVENRVNSRYRRWKEGGFAEQYPHLAKFALSIDVLSI